MSIWRARESDSATWCVWHGMRSCMRSLCLCVFANVLESEESIKLDISIESGLDELDGSHFIEGSKMSG